MIPYRNFHYWCIIISLIPSSEAFVLPVLKDQTTTRHILAGRSNDNNNIRDNIDDEDDNNNNEQQLSCNRRRDLLEKIGSTAAASLVALPLSTHAATTDTTSQQVEKPLADLPMIRLQLPKGAVGREYMAVNLKINDLGPYDFMVNTGLTTELITPHLQQTLGLNKETNVAKLLGAMLGDLALPPLDAVVTNFPQEHIDPAHDPIEGMLGMEMLRLFDVDFDFPNGRLRFWKPGTVPKTGLVDIPASIINQNLLYGIRVTTSSSPGRQQQQPILGILDSGSTFSAVNLAGAELLRLTSKSNNNTNDSPTQIMKAVGVDGQPLTLEMKSGIEFTFAGKPDPTGLQFFVPPPNNWKPWNEVSVGVGDLPVFSQVLGDGKRPFLGPAALIGLDVLSQRRIIFETGNGRKRRVFIEPS